MSYKNKKSLILQVKENLDSKLTIGQSKHAAKRAGTYKQHIYSWGTYKAYLQQCCAFVKWCKAQARVLGNKQPRTLQDCREYIKSYMEHVQDNYSTYTAKLILSALCKLYGEYPAQGLPFGLAAPLEKRNRDAITRSRQERAGDKHISQSNNADIITFCKCSGLRRAELAQIRGADLDGNTLTVYRATKGGRVRLVELCGSPEELETVQRLAAAAGTGKIFPKIHSNLDVHAYRAEYAKRVYTHYARPVDHIPQQDKYFCRGNMAGTVLDRNAMRIASNNLGHSRIDVIAGHYLYNL